MPLHDETRQSVFDGDYSAARQCAETALREGAGAEDDLNRALVPGPRHQPGAGGPRPE